MHWRSPEFGGYWYRSKQLKRRFATTLWAGGCAPPSKCAEAPPALKVRPNPHFERLDLYQNAAICIANQTSGKRRLSPTRRRACLTRMSGPVASPPELGPPTSMLVCPFSPQSEIKSLFRAPGFVPKLDGIWRPVVKTRRLERDDLVPLGGVRA